MFVISGLAYHIYHWWERVLGKNKHIKINKQNHQPPKLVRSCEITVVKYLNIKQE